MDDLDQAAKDAGVSRFDLLYGLAPTRPEVVGLECDECGASFIKMASGLYEFSPTGEWVKTSRLCEHLEKTFGVQPGQTNV
jgi:hypothetical protein